MSIKATRSDPEHLPCVVEVIGADIYNLALTGDKACSLTSIVCYSEKRFFEWREDDKSVNIRASSGSYGGGSEVLVCTKE